MHSARRRVRAEDWPALARPAAASVRSRSDAGGFHLRRRLNERAGDGREVAHFSRAFSARQQMRFERGPFLGRQRAEDVEARGLPQRIVGGRFSRHQHRPTKGFAELDHREPNPGLDCAERLIESRRDFGVRETLVYASSSAARCTRGSSASASRTRATCSADTSCRSAAPADRRSRRYAAACPPVRPRAPRAQPIESATPGPHQQPRGNRPSPASYREACYHACANTS